VAGGTVHTMGGGAVLVETQQQSDTTYRLYDYGRPRELHLERGMASVKEKVSSGKVIRPAPVAMDGKSRKSQMISAPFFVVDLFELKAPLDLVTRDASGKTSAQILTVLEGFGVVEVPGCEPVTMGRGDAVVIPASLDGFTVRPQWSVEFLLARVPGEALAEPATRQ